MLRFAVVGNPVSHSKSPQIHSLFAQQFGLQLDYTREEVMADGFDQFVTAFFAEGGRGLNVTVPFKERAFKIARSHSSRAAVAGAVNTLYLDRQSRLTGDNTDGIGLVRDLRDNNGIGIRNSRLLVIGAGGAVRGALGSLVDERPRSITLVNRTLSRAVTLKEEFERQAGCSIEITVAAIDQQPDQAFDLVINGTSSGLQGQVPSLSSRAISSETCCYDMLYGNAETAFMKWAADRGAARVIDGLGMLVEQAAESFNIWLQHRPDTASVIAAVRATLN